MLWCCKFDADECSSNGRGHYMLNAGFEFRLEPSRNVIVFHSFYSFHPTSRLSWQLGDGSRSM